MSGPKGVINDWRKYKQLEVEQKQEQKKEMERLIKRLSMSCRSDLDLEKDEEKKKELQDKIQGKVSRMGDHTKIILVKSSSAKNNCSSFILESRWNMLLILVYAGGALDGKRLNSSLF